MAKITYLDKKKREQLFIKKLKPGEMYRFSKVVKTKFLVKGESQTREINFAFNKGVYLKFVEEKDCLIFRGEPLVDIGSLGEGAFLVPLDLEIKLTPIKKIRKKQ